MTAPAKGMTIGVRIAAGLALVAAAAAPGSASTRADGKKDDSERQICKSKPVVGSRLKRVRECATAQQWQDMELQERLGLMRKQINGDPGCSGGHAQSCNPAANGGRDTPW